MNPTPRLSLATLPPEMLADLQAHYARPVRAYHNFDHVQEVLAQFEAVAAGPGWQQPDAVFLALLYHDAIYEAGRKDNEARSAELAAAALARWLPAHAGHAPRVQQLILLTARHGHLASEALDADAALFVDCDMAILAAGAERFDAYDREIAQEYRGKLPQWMFRHYRRRFLRGLLDSAAIYVSAWFRERCEAAARANIARCLAGRSALKSSAGR